MDVYNQAVEIIDTIRQGRGTAKGLVLQKHIEKKRQTFAIVCEVTRNYDKLQELLQIIHWDDRTESATLAVVLAYDAVLGRGINTRRHAAARAMLRLQPRLIEAWASMQHDVSPGLPRLRSKYVRRNRLFVEAAQGGRKRAREEALGWVPDAIIPDLFRVTTGAAQLFHHRWIQEGRFVIHDRGSAIPACVMMGAVPLGKSRNHLAPRVVVDACAAPGNKTTHLAALGGKVVAVERDQTRFQLLKRRVFKLRAAPLVTFWKGCFFELSSVQRAEVDGVLLDPTCSASGMVDRVDVEHRTVEREQVRVAQLAKLQKKMLVFALTEFPKAFRVVYSTCSVHREENEMVVAAALNEPSVQALGWRLVDIMPGLWTSRGLPDGDMGSLPLKRTLRCDPANDHCYGFFVACFDRVL